MHQKLGPSTALAQSRLEMICFKMSMHAKRTLSASLQMKEAEQESIPNQ